MTAQPSVHTASGRKGKAVEHPIAASCILASNGDLNASTSLVDDEGVDIVFHRRGGSRTLAVQVKSRFWDTRSLSDKRQFLADIRDITFKPRPDLYLLFVAVKWQEPEFGPLWLIPSSDFATSVKSNPRGMRRFSASAKDDTQDRWRKYRIDKTELSNRLLAILGEI